MTSRNRTRAPTTDATRLPYGMSYRSAVGAPSGPLHLKLPTRNRPTRKACAQDARACEARARPSPEPDHSRSMAKKTSPGKTRRAPQEDTQPKVCMKDEIATALDVTVLVSNRY